MPPEARPRERLKRHGAGVLSELELLSLILGHGGAGSPVADLASRVLASAGGTLRGLARVDAGELSALPGIGDAGASRIVAAVELGRRVADAPTRPGRPIAGPGDVWRFMRAVVGDLAHEEFHVVLLNAQNVPICNRQVTRGILDASLIHPREVFRDAIVRRAAALVLVHNHPSGDPEPSAEDVRVTRQLVRAGDELGIPVVDHVVVGRGSYVSLAARGILRSPDRTRESSWHVRDPVRRSRDGEEGSRGSGRLRESRFSGPNGGFRR